MINFNRFYVIRHIVIFFILIHGFEACSYKRSYPENVLASLNKAEEHSTELKRVLDYYQVNDADSLKFKAACFLISNMQYHSSNYSLGKIPEVIKRSFSFVDSLTKAYFFSINNKGLFEVADYLHFQLDTDEFLPTNDVIDSLLNKKFGNDSSIQRFKREMLYFESKTDSVAKILLDSVSIVSSTDGVFRDIDIIKADWLIAHIEHAFKMWQTSPYSRDMSFEEFSETLLSYRSLYEAVDYNFSSEACSKLLSEIVFSNNQDVAECIRRLNFYIYAMDCFEDKGKNLGHLGFYDLLQFYKYDCDRHSEWTVKVLNACGIPAYLDYTSGFFIRDKMHYGVSVRDTSGRYHHFTPKWQQLGEKAHGQLFSKVFRRTFSPQKSPSTLKNNIESLPPIFFDPCFVDVTDEFHDVSDVSIKYKENLDSNNIAYIGIFSPKGWKPIGWGKINRQSKTVDFEKVPLNKTYIAGLYENNVLTPFSEPFQIAENGKVEFIRVDRERKIDLHLVRKYPLKYKLVQCMRNMIGSKIEGSTTKGFKNPELLHVLQISDIEDFGVAAISIRSKRKFRYLRIVPPTGNMLNIALFEVLSKRNSKKEFRKPTLAYVYKNKDTIKEQSNSLIKLPFEFLPNGQNFSNVVDESMLTYACSYDFEIDLGDLQGIDEVRIAPRNDDNTIVVGNKYRLYYYDKKWEIFGEQIAKYNFLNFANVPDKTIYWLHNLSGGKEELIFTYINEKQSFVNYEELNEYN